MFLLAAYGAWCILSGGAFVLEHLLSRSLRAERHVVGCAAHVAGWRYILWASGLGVYLWLDRAVPSERVQVIAWCWVALALVGGLLLWGFGDLALCR